MTRRRALIAAVALAAACRPGGEGDGTTLNVQYMGDERLFGPYWSVEAWFVMFLPLVTWDERGEIAPALARRWERSDDARTWTFHLRSDVRWHDGVPTTAHDVKFTLELQARPEVLFDDAWHDLDSIGVPDDTTLVLHYRRPKDALSTWMVYWPRHLLEGLDPRRFWEWDFWVRPVGNGPYRYLRHVPQTMVELEANPDFYAGEPRIPRVRFKFGGSTAVTELLSGGVDVVAWANYADLPKIAADPRFRVYYQLSPEVPWLKVIAWNLRRPSVADARARRAFAAGVNRRELMNLLNLPPDLRLADAPYTPRQYLRGELPAEIPFDPDQAAHLLEEAGWRDRDGDGIRERSGVPMRITILVAEARDQVAAVYVQAALRRLGVDVQVSPLDERVLRSRFSSGDFDAAFRPFWNHPDSHLGWFGPGTEHSEQRRPESQVIGYRNPEVARLIAAARAAFDLEERDRLYAEAAPLVRADQPLLFLYPTAQAYVVSRRVRGLMPPYRADPIQFIHQLWLEGAR